MNKYQKVVFITELIKNVQNDILKKVDKMPEQWDGIELRPYIAGEFAEIVIKGVLKGKRLKDYKNTIIVNNL